MESPSRYLVPRLHGKEAKNMKIIIDWENAGKDLTEMGSFSVWLGVTLSMLFWVTRTPFYFSLGTSLIFAGFWSFLTTPYFYAISIINQGERTP